MICREAQARLSLYLYGELAFTEEEELEQHLSECAVCERALASEKAWHSSVNAEQIDVPLELLGECRGELHEMVVSAGRRRQAADAQRPGWLGRFGWFGFSPSQWSMRLAVGSFLVITGFSAAQYFDRHGLPGNLDPSIQSMGVIDPSVARVREIEPAENNRVRVVFEQQRAITGPADSDAVRRLLLAATQDEADPGIRMDSVEVLDGQAGEDVRDALLNSVRHDPNAAVRLKAVEALGRFGDDASVRQGLVYVLQHDDNPGVRSQAIDVLAASGSEKISPEMADALETVVRSSQPDDYIRVRCLRLLRSSNAPFEIY